MRMTMTMTMTMMNFLRNLVLVTYSDKECFDLELHHRYLEEIVLGVQLLLVVARVCAIQI